jgi:hypothetical protein
VEGSRQGEGGSRGLGSQRSFLLFVRILFFALLGVLYRANGRDCVSGSSIYTGFVNRRLNYSIPSYEHYKHALFQGYSRP